MIPRLSTGRVDWPSLAIAVFSIWVALLATAYIVATIVLWPF